MMRLPNLTKRNAMIAAHDVLATVVALLASFYLRFEGDLLTDRLPLLFRILPWFVAFSVVVCYVFNLTTTKWRFSGRVGNGPRGGARLYRMNRIPGLGA